MNKNYRLITQRLNGPELHRYYETMDLMVAQMRTLLEQKFVGKMTPYILMANTRWLECTDAFDAVSSQPIPEQVDLFTQLGDFCKMAAKSKTMLSDEQKLDLERLVGSIYQLEGIVELSEDWEADDGALYPDPLILDEGALDSLDGPISQDKPWLNEKLEHLQPLPNIVFESIE